MGLVQYSLALLMLSTQLVLSLPTTKKTYTVGGRECDYCPAGMYSTDCTTCEYCPAGTYTTDWNYEDECHHCFGDCNPKFHLKVVQNCTSTSDMKCDCEDGFTCTRWTREGNCMACKKMPDPTSTKVAATEISDRDKHMPSSVSSGHSSTSPRPCHSPGCHPTKEPIPTPGHANRHLAAIFIPLLQSSGMRKGEVLLTSQRSQLISSPETHSVQSSSPQLLQQPILVRSMCTIQAQSSLACSVNLRVKSGQ
ncbi:unnamed protein product [Oreochromis niloticus]|nr:unnamed protein product [Mustela putorius furo]